MKRSDIGPFALCAESVYTSGISDGAVRVYLVLAKSADNEEGSCWPSVDTIAAKVHKAKSTVRAILRELEDAGLIVVKSRYDTIGRQSSNEYFIVRAPKLEQVQRTRQKPGGATPEINKDDPPEIRRETRQKPGGNLDPLELDPNEKVRAGTADPPPGWVDFVSVYPERSGPKKEGEAKRLFEDAVASGVDPERIVAGAKRYAEWCRKTGKTGKELVQQMRTFLRESAWEEEFEVPDPVEAPRPKLVVGNDGVARFEETG